MVADFTAFLSVAADDERVVETVALEPRTAHHEDITDAIERAVVASRLER